MKFRIDLKYNNVEDKIVKIFEKELCVKLTPSNNFQLSGLDFVVYSNDEKIIHAAAEIKTKKESLKGGSWYSFHKNKEYSQCHPETKSIIENIDKSENNDIRNFLIEFLCQLWPYYKNLLSKSFIVDNIWLIQEDASHFEKAINATLEKLSNKKILSVDKKFESDNFLCVAVRFLN